VAANRDTSKQKRARENRAQREALKARKEAASKPAAERRAASTPKTSGAASSSADQPARKGGFFSGGNRGPRPGDLPVDVATLQGNWIQKRMLVPGGRHVVSALVLSILLSVMLGFQRFPPEGDPDGKATESIFDLVGALGWGLLLYPIVVIGIAAQLSLHPKRRRIWMVCTIVLGAAVMALLQLYIVHLIVVGYMIFAMQKAAKVEGPLRPRPGAATQEDAVDAEDEATAGEVDEPQDPVQDRPA
jgi:phage shock protein PspC (stress-responsive transcriptional regulator)